MLVELKLPNGTTVGVPQTGELTLGEWRIVKERTGLNILAFEEAVGATDPEAWATLIAIGATRSDPAITEDALNEVNFMDVLNAIQAAAEDEEEQADPPQAADDAAAPDENPGPAMILDGAGPRA